MSVAWIILAYGSAVTGALLALYLFRAQAWYWHVISILAALAVGLMPPPAGWSGSWFDLLTGFVFTALFLWGAAAPFFRGPYGHG
jgi:hypothetical protein